MFGWIKRLFKKGKKQEPAGQPAATQEVPLEEAREIAEEHPAAKPAAGPAMESAKEQPSQERKERICPKCGAPNDVFTDICWLCKEKSW
jgi:NADH pyrophosphatase NudC (nudix superfamily)